MSTSPYPSLKASLAFTMFACALLILPVALAAQGSTPLDTMSAMRSAVVKQGMASAPELPHPFFTHMGMPEGVGVYSLRVGGLASQGVDPAIGTRRSDFFFNFETGLTERIGVHVRNDQFRSMPRTEVMFQFLALQSRDGMAGSHRSSSSRCRHALKAVRGSTRSPGSPLRSRVPASPSTPYSTSTHGKT